ncbi:MAG: ribokinase [Pseudomonadota bacterium]
MNKSLAILGVFVADTAYRADRMPKMGETILGNRFALGPGGKGSNQAVAAARAGGAVTFLSRLGQDAFADMALKTWAEAGVQTAIEQDAQSFTGAAYIFVEEASGDNAIIICPGAASDIDVAFVERHADTIASAKIFMTQLEQPTDAALRGLQIARDNNARTILNPAPAATLPDEMLALCDFVTPNESEAEGLTGRAVKTVDDARSAAEMLLAKGAGAAVITLGEQGALLHDSTTSVHVPAMSAGEVVETTGAGDAFNGAFATALCEGKDALSAVQFGCACAALSVTRAGTAPSMPSRDEIDALMK